MIHINFFEICIVMFSILFAGKHEKMATYPSKVSLCLIALFWQQNQSAIKQHGR